MNTENKTKTSSKTLKGQLFGAVAMMLVAAIALGTSTYAWFISNSTVEVQNMKLTVSTSTSMTVAVGKQNGTDWTGYKTVVSNEDISGLTPVGAPSLGDVADWTHMFVNPLDPASVTTASLISTAPKFFHATGLVVNNKLTTFSELPPNTAGGNATVTAPQVGQGYVKKIPLKFLGSTDLDVFFGKDALTEIANLISPVVTTGTTEEIEASAAQANAIRTALRVSIVPHATGTVAPITLQFDDGSTIVVAGAGNNTDYNGQAPVINETTGTYSAVSAISTADDATKNKITAIGPLNALIPTAAKPSIAGVTVSATPGEAAVVKCPSAVAGDTTHNDTHCNPIFQLKANEERKVDVYIWLEGTDKDCVSTLSTYAFNLNLPFAAIVTSADHGIIPTP